MSKLEIGYRYTFGELKAGDRFSYLGDEYEKLSGNSAERLVNGQLPDMNDEKCNPVEFISEATVFLYELG